MKLYRLTLQPLTAFGTPLVGDTFFGQLCWALRHQLGNDRLAALLEGYAQGRPFAVAGDAFPSGFVPLPALPSRYWQATENADRKVLKKKRWLPLAALTAPLPNWQAQALDDKQVLARPAPSPQPSPARGEGATILHEGAAQHRGQPSPARGEGAGYSSLHTSRSQPHNTINRATGTTGEGQFAPYAMQQIWYAPGVTLDIYLALDEARLSIAELISAIDYIGSTGYGRDASIGLGKFERIGLIPSPLAGDDKGDASSHYLTLGPCAPQGLGFCGKRSYYQTFTRFGRHGDIAVQSGKPFKRPVLLAKAGAVFMPEQINSAAVFIGQGLNGVSIAMPETVQQGYAPVLTICLSQEEAMK